MWKGVFVLYFRRGDYELWTLYILDRRCSVEQLWKVVR